MSKGLKAWEGVRWLSDRERDEIDLEVKAALRRSVDRVRELEAAEKRKCISLVLEYLARADRCPCRTSENRQRSKTEPDVVLCQVSQVSLCRSTCIRRHHIPSCSHHALPQHPTLECLDPANQAARDESAQAAREAQHTGRIESRDGGSGQGDGSGSQE